MLRIFGFLLVLLAPSVEAEPLTVKTYLGQIEVSQAPENVAVFDLSAFDSITALGVPIQGLIRPVILDYLEDAAVGTTPVGSLFEPDFESVFALSPDLIIAGEDRQNR